MLCMTEREKWVKEGVRVWKGMRKKKYMSRQNKEYKNTLIG